ncbi:MULTISPECIES: D-tagatose-bisphosphate aldolase, class II, non-catalytic subunit [Burkholderia]|uniref:D-tagatose-bisphosphate aldolase, class II, non-catalytic subunit n=2 Tax=Burkholderia vietnamiensis TaxID=60552 RepID=A0AAW7T9C5_BURVI|nr:MULTISPECIES: D-tagatose-bisphosphate aldolase, class II, non-catalytic subunit [Burkholderia]AOK10948.1 tagatose-bisphosphate aldolase [Burkholderia vietnamiensis]KKI35011.1 tagatose-bisphosphate aldolase [Burkholderia vietnamiensis]MDN7797388.1 D-tagatose-bisphosphate aldolase, class II, non-catalytic subunit [Burkholderia vietnamiensis]MDN8034527.1 D-tagatose-bisphosphate aldolase, class II, non-catalytic subunit [Burkholderia vietnamiensis]RQM51236.1 D-tagatose-bisphosphate aldolase, cl
MPGLTSTVEPPRTAHAHTVLRMIFDANRGGAQRGIYSVCSAHRLVLEAACEAARADGSPLLIEATCNQVNHVGGYTGMTPADFRRDVDAIAQRCGLAPSALVLGGDHLGPNPWRHRRAADAMREAAAMVAAYVEAGFEKIHLDASMACADDPARLDDRTIAARAAQLCRAAESAASRAGLAPVYVIGTEVPTPGGEVSADGAAIARIAVTRSDSIGATLDAHRSAFAAAGLDDAWTRVVAVVAQPGVDFDDRHVLDYDSAKAAALGASILRVPRLVFEAHSTDYQTEHALAALVRDHFAVLKVGPALTFALREALFALSFIEDALIGDVALRSRLRDVVDAAMRAQPEHWAPYYRGDEAEQRLARQFGYSDRIRYYWLQPAVAAAVEQLFDNLARQPVPETLVAQWLPDVYAACRAGVLAKAPRAWVRHRIRDVIAHYARACGMQRPV